MSSYWLRRGTTVFGVKQVGPDIYAVGTHGSNLVLMRVDESANILWYRTVPADVPANVGNVCFTDTAFYFAQTAGSTNVFKIDLATGDVLWKKNITGSGANEFHRSLAISADGGVTVLTSTAFTNFILTRLDSEGTIVWSKRLNIQETTGSIVYGADGYLYMCGYGRRVVKFSGSDGSIIWQKKITGINESLVVEVGETGVYVAGRGTVLHPVTSVSTFVLCLLKLNLASGEIIWSKAAHDGDPVTDVEEIRFISLVKNSIVVGGNSFKASPAKYNASAFKFDSDTGTLLRNQSLATNGQGVNRAFSASIVNGAMWLGLGTVDPSTSTTLTGGLMRTPDNTDFDCTGTYGGYTYSVNNFEEFNLAATVADSTDYSVLGNSTMTSTSVVPGSQSSTGLSWKTTIYFLVKGVIPRALGWIRGG